MLTNLKNIFKVQDLRNKVLFTLAMIVLYRLGAHLPVPGIDVGALTQLRDRAESSGILGFLSLFSGGALTNFAIFALGIMPYITASIIMQILGVVIPKLEEWQNQGAVGQRKITQWTRYVTIGIAILQSTGLAYLFHNGGGGLRGGSTGLDLVPNFDAGHVLLIVLTLTSGTALLMWIGELVTQTGHRQRHVAADLRLGGRRPPEPVHHDQGQRRLDRRDPGARRLHRHPGGHRVRRAGPTSHPGAVRQAGGGPSDVRRPEHLHPAEGQPVGRHPDHLRQLGAVPAPAAQRRAALRRLGCQPPGLDRLQPGACPTRRST